MKSVRRTGARSLVQRPVGWYRRRGSGVYLNRWNHLQRSVHSDPNAIDIYTDQNSETVYRFLSAQQDTNGALYLSTVVGGPLSRRQVHR
jgi:hypothetical protein